MLKKKKNLKHNPQLISPCIYEAIFHTVFSLPYLDYGFHNTKIFLFYLSILENFIHIYDVF